MSERREWPSVCLPGLAHWMPHNQSWRHEKGKTRPPQFCCQPQLLSHVHVTLPTLGFTPPVCAAYVMGLPPSHAGPWPFGTLFPNSGASGCLFAWILASPIALGEGTPLPLPAHGALLSQACTGPMRKGTWFLAHWQGPQRTTLTYSCPLVFPG